MLTGHADTECSDGRHQRRHGTPKFILAVERRQPARHGSLAWNSSTWSPATGHWKTGKRQKSRKSRRSAGLAVTHRNQLGIMLHKKNLLNAAQLQELALLRAPQEPLISLLIGKGLGRRTVQTLTCSSRTYLSRGSVAAEFRIDPVLAELIPHSFCQRQLVVPRSSGVAVARCWPADPLDEGLIDEVRFHRRP